MKTLYMLLLRLRQLRPSGDLPGGRGPAFASRPFSGRPDGLAPRISAAQLSRAAAGGARSASALPRPYLFLFLPEPVTDPRRFKR